ncbi:hypothetical protein BDF19DRAFT_265324 [Syncephalis fuscata]|nr:hypothetical protein BDF19DRAFT_265324 [Syncephalis fuscata]
MSEAKYTSVCTVPEPGTPKEQEGSELDVINSSGGEEKSILDNHDSNSISDIESDKDITSDENSPYESVCATVSNKDDPTLPSLTFRFWVLAIPLTIIVSLFNQVFWFRTLSVGIGGMIMQLSVFPLGNYWNAHCPAE